MKTLSFTLILLNILLIKTNAQEIPYESITNFLKADWIVELVNNEIEPAFNGGFLFVSENLVINAMTGEKLSSPFDSNIIKDSLLIFGTEDKLEVFNIKSNNQILSSLRRRARYVGPDKYKISNDSIWIEVNYKMHIVAINLNNNEKIWSTPSASRIVDEPVIRNDKVFVVNEEEILVLRRNDGAIINRFPTGGQVLSKLTFQNSNVYFIVRDVGLISINLEINKIEWKFALERYSGHITKIIVDKEVVYFADNNLYALDRNNGEIIWKHGVDHSFFIRRPDYLSEIKDYLLFYIFKDNENLLTVADKNTGNILYQGFNSNVVGGDSNNPDGVAKEDLWLIDFMNEFIHDSPLIGMMDNKIYGFEVLK